MALRDEHYEKKFEFALWKLIKERAEEKDVSYVQAAAEVLPEWDKEIRYRDEKFNRAETSKRQKEIAELKKRAPKKKLDGRGF